MASKNNPGVAVPLLLPAAPDHYDKQNEQQLRRILQEAGTKPPAFASLTSVPTPVGAVATSPTGAADEFFYYTSPTAMALTALTAYARTLLGGADAAVVRALLLRAWTRTNHPVTTASLANLAIENGSISIPSILCALATITTTDKAWVRLYATQAAQIADSARAYGTLPTAGTGVLAEFDFTAGGAQTVPTSPVPWLSNDEGTPTTRVWYAIQNRKGSAATVTITLDIADRN